MNAEVDKNMVRRYLLGALPEDEQVRLEMQYFADNEKFEQVWALENELVDEYVRGRLPQPERALFERNYLASPKHQARVTVARQLLQAADAVIVEDIEARAVRNPPPTPSWLSKLSSLFRTPQLAWGGALALLLLTLSGWFYWRTMQAGPEQIAQASPTLVVQSSPAMTPAGTTPVTSPSTTPQPTAQPSPSARPAAPAVLAFTLVASVVRDASKIQTLSIPPDTKQVQFKMNLADEEYPQYQIKLRTVAGKKILTQATLKPAANKKSVLVSIPSKQLPPGDYFLALFGVSQDNEAEELITYFFRVNKK